MSPTSLNRPFVDQGCIYNLSFLCVWSMGAIFRNLSPGVTLKMGSRSPKSNQFLSLSQQYGYTSLVKMHPFILKIGYHPNSNKESVISLGEEDSEILFMPPTFFKVGGHIASGLSVHSFIHHAFWCIA